MHYPSSRRARGFTLLELIIVIAILAILATAVVLVINPAETLRKSRDSNRVTELGALRSAIALYITEQASPDLDGANSCSTNIWISEGTVDDIGGVSGVLAANVIQVTVGTRDVDGTGWVPVNFMAISGGAPFSALPVDPATFVANRAELVDSDRVYIYDCDATALTFELNANMESTAYAAQETGDGGNNANVYETGTDPGLDLIGAW